MPTSTEINAAIERQKKALLSFTELDLQSKEIEIRKRAAHKELTLATDEVRAIRYQMLGA